MNGHLDNLEGSNVAYHYNDGEPAQWRHYCLWHVKWCHGSVGGSKQSFYAAGPKAEKIAQVEMQGKSAKVKERGHICSSCDGRSRASSEL